MSTNPSRTPTTSAVQVPGNHDLNARLDALRVCLGDLSSGEAGFQSDDAMDRSHPSLMQHIGGISQAVQRMTAEQGGMAEELLSLYEQLGVVFEVSRSLGSVNNEHEVLELFVGSLRRSFAWRKVSVAQSNAEGKLSQDDAAEEDRGWLSKLIQESVQQGKVLVSSAPDDSHGNVAEAMVGPVIAGEPANGSDNSTSRTDPSLVCTLVLTRSSDGQEFRASDMLLLESLSLFCGDLIRNHRLVREMRAMSVTTVRALVSAVDQKDTYTSGHSIRVGFFATLLGRAIGLSEKDLTMLQWSALLHDVGKIGIRDDVLKKTGKLTKEEFDHIKEHPERSYQVVKGIPHLAGALDGVLYHHERLDGTGYPEGLIGTQVPLQARIVQIADIFDALTSNRSYRSAYDWNRALEILQEGSGTISDPHLLQEFENAVREAVGDDPEGWARLVDHAEKTGQPDSPPITPASPDGEVTALLATDPQETEA